MYFMDWKKICWIRYGNWSSNMEKQKGICEQEGKNEELVCLRQERGRTKIQYVECMWNVNATVVIDTDKNNNLGGLTGMK